MIFENGIWRGGHRCWALAVWIMNFDGSLKTLKNNLQKVTLATVKNLQGSRFEHGFDYDLNIFPKCNFLKVAGTRAQNRAEIDEFRVT